jgi:hypothetical protein
VPEDDASDDLEIADLSQGYNSTSTRRFAGDSPPEKNRDIQPAAFSTNAQKGDTGFFTVNAEESRDATSPDFALDNLDSILDELEKAGFADSLNSPVTPSQVEESPRSPTPPPGHPGPDAGDGAYSPDAPADSLNDDFWNDMQTFMPSLVGETLKSQDKGTLPEAEESSGFNFQPGSDHDTDDILSLDHIGSDLSAMTEGDTTGDQPGSSSPPVWEDTEGDSTVFLDDLDADDVDLMAVLSPDKIDSYMQVQGGSSTAQRVTSRRPVKTRTGKTRSGKTRTGSPTEVKTAPPASAEDLAKELNLEPEEDAKAATTIMSNDFFGGLMEMASATGVSEKPVVKKKPTQVRTDGDLENLVLSNLNDIIADTGKLKKPESLGADATTIMSSPFSTPASTEPESPAAWGSGENIFDEIRTLLEDTGNKVADSPPGAMDLGATQIMSTSDLAGLDFGPPKAKKTGLDKNFGATQIMSTADLVGLDFSQSGEEKAESDHPSFNWEDAPVPNSGLYVQPASPEAGLGEDKRDPLVAPEVDDDFAMTLEDLMAADSLQAGLPVKGVSNSLQWDPATAEDGAEDDFKAEDATGEDVTEDGVTTDEATGEDLTGEGAKAEDSPETDHAGGEVKAEASDGEESYGGGYGSDLADREDEENHPNKSAQKIVGKPPAAKAVAAATPDDTDDTDDNEDADATEEPEVEAINPLDVFANITDLDSFKDDGLDDEMKALLAADKAAEEATKVAAEKAAAAKEMLAQGPKPLKERLIAWRQNFVAQVKAFLKSDRFGKLFAMVNWKQNWWFYLDIMAALIATASSAIILSYYLWYR